MTRPYRYDDRHPLPGEGRPVENYTNAFLVWAGVLVFCALVMLWAIYGYVAPLVTAWAADRTVVWLSRRNRR